MSEVSIRRENSKIFLVVLLCLLGAGMGGSLLYYDLVAIDGGGKGKSMAIIERRASKVRRRPAGSYIWSNVQESQSLYRKDSIQTGPGSFTAIRLQDQSLLELGEESLVVIDDIQNLSLGFVRGSMVLRGAKGDRQISVEKDGKLKVEELSFRLLLPLAHAQFFSELGSKKQITFQWEIKKNRNVTSDSSLAEEAVFQISTHRSFEASKTKSLKIRTQLESNLQMQFPVGKYYWRIFGDGKSLTEVRFFQIGEAAALKPLWPTHETVKIKTWKEASSVQFRWSNPRDSGFLSPLVEHHLEIAGDEQFKSLIRNELIAAESGQAKLSGLQEGKFFWKIRSRFGDLTLASSPESFEIEKNQKLSMEPIFPLSGSSFELQKEHRFHWRTPLSADLEFQIEIQPQDPRLKSHQKNQWIQKLMTPSYILKNAVSGNYRWRVLAFHQNELLGETVWQNFNLFQGKPIQLVFPKNSQSIFYWDVPPVFHFSWERESQPKKQNYLFELAIDAEFKNKIYHEKSSELQILSSKAQLKSGLYYWRVGVLDAQGDVLKWSGIAKFILGHFPLLDPPQETQPVSGAVFDVVRGGQDPVLFWAPVKDAKAYEISVFSGETRSVLMKKNTQALSIQLTGLSEGNYFWSVRPIDPLKRVGNPMPQKSFQVSFGKPLEAPLVFTPEVQ